MKKEVKNLKASIKAQLQNKAKETNRPLFAEEIYDEKSDRQILWKAFLNKGDIKHVPEKLNTIARDIERFLIKPLVAINKNVAFNAKWKASGPWK